MANICASGLIEPASRIGTRNPVFTHIKVLIVGECAILVWIVSYPYMHAIDGDTKTIVDFPPPLPKIKKKKRKKL